MLLGYGYYSGLIYLIPGFLLSLYAQSKISSNYEKYRKVFNENGLTGAQVARKILDANGLNNVTIKEVNGRLTDHYDPRDKSLSLSPEVYENSSVASAAIAAHEVGHALQDKEKYGPLALRTYLAPGVAIGSNLGIYLVIMGLIFSDFLLNLGIGLFILAVAFSIITLPVEFNASARAKEELKLFMSDRVMEGTEKVLSAAALTYVASTLVSIGNLLRLLALRNRSRR